MPLSLLQINHFRNLTSVQLEPLTNGFNFIYGLNGSGKTSLLESIYYLSLGRSFRSHLINRVVHHGAEKFVLFANNLINEQHIPIGIEKFYAGDSQIRINGQDIQTLSALTHLTPVQLINSDCFNLLDAGPSTRRKFIDWGVFYHNKQFLPAWRDYVQVIKQRNALLKQQKNLSAFVSWDQVLATKALKLTALREAYMADYLPLLAQKLQTLLPNFSLDINFYPGWDLTQDLTQLLLKSFDKDRQLGYTQLGPHRADLKIKINKIAAKDILSRGQQKLFVCAMILAQGELLLSANNKQPIYLIDDLPAELDTMSRSKLITELALQNTQFFITAVERLSLENVFQTLPVKMFHVEHGRFTETI